MIVFVLPTEKVYHGNVLKVKRRMIARPQSTFCGGYFELVGIGGDERNGFFKLGGCDNAIECQNFFGGINSAQHINVDDIINLTQFLVGLTHECGRILHEMLGAQKTEFLAAKSDK